MYRSKELGRNTYQFLDANLAEHRLRQHTLETALRTRAGGRRVAAALPAGGAHRTTARSSAPRRCCAGADPEHGSVPPQVFIPLAEESGLIHALGEWVLKTAADAVRRVAHGGHAAHGVGQPVRAAVLPRRPGAAHFGDRQDRGMRARRGSSSKSPRRACCTTSTRFARCSTSCATRASRSRSTTSAPATRR